MIKRYRKKPVVIEAIQFKDTVDCLKAIADFMDVVTVSYYNEDDPLIKISTLDGIMHAKEGDFIIKGVKGEFYPCKTDIFKTTYDEVE